jgi:hypothetical protein
MAEIEQNLPEDSHPHSHVQNTFRQRVLIGVEVDPAGLFINHIYRVPSNKMYANGMPMPDEVYKEQYVVGPDLTTIELREVITGEHTPGYYVPEQITFNH